MPASRQQTGIVRQLDCNAAVNGNAGCGVASGNQASYGRAFNNARGGHYVMQRTSTFIKVWFFARGTAPAEITNGNSQINPANWVNNIHRRSNYSSLISSSQGTPFAYFPNTSCNLASHFGK
jgi:hypothetical protein